MNYIKTVFKFTQSDQGTVLEAIKELSQHHNLFFQGLAIQGLVADLHQRAPHSEPNYSPLLISGAYVEALGELDPTLFHAKCRLNILPF